MTANRDHLASWTKEFHGGHAIVMTAVTIAALIFAAALLASFPAAGQLPAPHDKASAAAERAVSTAVIPQSLGYLEFDWSSKSGGVPGFEPLPSTGDFGAGEQ